MAEFSPDGHSLASVSFDGNLRTWNAATGKMVLDIKAHPAPIWYFQFSPNGKNIITASADRTVKTWNVADGNNLLTLQRP